MLVSSFIPSETAQEVISGPGVPGTMRPSCQARSGRPLVEVVFKRNFLQVTWLRGQSDLEWCMEGGQPRRGNGCLGGHPWAPCGREEAGPGGEANVPGSGCGGQVSSGNHEAAVSQREAGPLE